jgi:putative membrane protein
VTENDKERIRSAVKNAEGKTSGEIVPMIVSASYHYPMADITGAFSIAFPLSILLTIEICRMLWLGNQNMWIFILVFAVLFAVSRSIVRRSVWLKRPFLSHREVEEEVCEAALTAFYNQGLYRTVDQTGVLIFISLLERKVWVLADRGINEKVEKDRWEGIVNHIITGIREKRHVDAICEAIAMAGDLLVTHFPVKSDDTDELTNLIVED